jgi:hypothetical protein
MTLIKTKREEKQNPIKFIFIHNNFFHYLIQLKRSVYLFLEYEK